MSDAGFIYTPADFLGWALQSGWRPGRMPIGVVYTFQAPLARALSERADLFEENTDLTISNAKMLMTRDEGPPILVACLNPGAAAMVTQLEHLRFLGDVTRYAAIVGTAGTLTTDFTIAAQVVVDSALRCDGVSDRYLPPAAVVGADAAFTAALSRALGAPQGRSWTVPVPYRSTREELDSARAAGAALVEMEIAALFAAARALDMRAAATVVVSDASRVENWQVDWSDTTPPLVEAVLETIAVIRSLEAED